MEGTAPKKPNVYSDGRLTNTKGYFWLVGGADREVGTITKEESVIAEFKEHYEAADIFDPDAVEREERGLCSGAPSIQD